MTGVDPEAAPRAAADTPDIAALDHLVGTCRACPRLVAWREEVAVVKRAAFRDEPYWGRPVPGFGPADARMLVVGLAPAAHGGNRTGRMFTGDPSGNVLFGALHAVGLATGARPVSRDDGIELLSTRLTAPVHCAPPENKPTPEERQRCAPFLSRELELLRPTLRVIVVLGAFGWQALFTVLLTGGWNVPRPRPRFAHGAHVVITHPDGRSVTVLGSYHVSQRNTATGRVTAAMVEDVLSRAKTIAES
ncbi:uracil-DNA glycosylase [Nocardia fluminea]|jgi:uracil-DNA glycosylase family 4|uniref:uracil-DNA glycosylase n=1 Tax=Nocardia fluminea TaxID=134984 RepID=UPI003404F019